MASTTLQNYEQLSYGGAASQWVGQHQAIISDAVATRVLLPKEAGSLCMFDRAAGTTYTLPTGVAGMTFEFATILSVTSVGNKVITAAAGQFLVGAVITMTIATASGAGFSADGTTIRSINGSGTTTGGLIGDRYKLVAVSATQWQITGLCIGSGTIVTPFATS